MVTQNKHITN